MNNKHKLPQVMINALTHNEYTSGGADFSATTLLKPPQMVQLERRHGKRSDTDIVDNLWSVFGTAVHNLMESVAEDDAIIEKRIHTDKFGPSISGAIDHYKDGAISDYKVTSAWKLVNKDFTEWEQQLNIYAELYRMEDYAVDTLQIICIVRDWSKMQALRSPDYPQAPVVVVPIKLWSHEDTVKFIMERVSMHQVAAANQNEANLQPCTDKERWYTGTKYAVMKGKNVRATKLCDSHQDAMDYIGDKPSMHIVERPGEHRRCKDYCPVSHVCQQWKAINES